MARRPARGKVGHAVIARSVSSEAIQLSLLTLACFACARNDAEKIPLLADAAHRC